MIKVAVLFAVLFAVLRVEGQIRIEVQLDQEQYLPNESLVARVRIHNSSGQTLRLGEAPNWLNFAIESQDGKYVRPLKTPEVQGVFDLESSSIATKRVDLAQCFDLTELGSYKVVATIHVPAFKENYASPSKRFIIGTGSRIGNELVIGVPAPIGTPGPDGKPEVRKYVLIQTNPGAEAKLFVRVTDAENKNIKVVPIGGLVGLSRPEPQVDRWSNLHLLYQTGSRSMLYTMINPEGMVLAKETHEITGDSRPTLIANDVGRILVKGGARRYTSHDIPPVDPVLASAVDQIPQAPTPVIATNVPAKKKDSSKDAKEKSTKR